MKKKVIYILVASFVIIAADYAREYYSFQKHNQSPLQIETPDGTNQPYHPSVLFISQKWNGYRYWMAETPYPLGNNGDWNGLKPYRARWENPCIHVSNDGINWQTPPKGSNPIDDLSGADIEHQNYYSDTHLVMKNDTLECWYRINKVHDNKLFILRKYSIDGVHWSERETMIQIDLNVDSCNQIISPSVLYRPQKGYTMWYVDRVNGKREIRTQESENGKDWNNKNMCLLSGKDINPWHIDIQFIDNKYYMVVYDHKSLTLWKSNDGVSFQLANQILEPSSKVGSFYSSGLYRSALLKDDEGYKLFFSAFEKKTVIGLMTGSSPQNLKIFSVSGNFVSFTNFPMVYLRLKKQELLSLLKKDNSSDAKISIQ